MLDMDGKDSTAAAAPRNDAGAGNIICGMERMWWWFPYARTYTIYVGLQSIFTFQFQKKTHVIVAAYPPSPLNTSKLMQPSMYIVLSEAVTYE